MNSTSTKSDVASPENPSQILGLDVYEFHHGDPAAVNFTYDSRNNCAHFMQHCDLASVHAILQPD